jgi:hypothetical protein
MYTTQNSEQRKPPHTITSLSRFYSRFLEAFTVFFFFRFLLADLFRAPSAKEWEEDLKKSAQNSEQMSQHKEKEHRKTEIEQENDQAKSQQQHRCVGRVAGQRVGEYSGDEQEEKKKRMEETQDCQKRTETGDTEMKVSGSKKQ